MPPKARAAARYPADRGHQTRRAIFARAEAADDRQDIRAFPAGSKAPPTATGSADVVIGGTPSTETAFQSNTVSPVIRFAARSGSTAEATHMIDDPGKTEERHSERRALRLED